MNTNDIPRCYCHRMLMKYAHTINVGGVLIGMYKCSMGGLAADYGPARDDVPPQGNDDRDDSSAVMEVA